MSLKKVFLISLLFVLFCSCEKEQKTADIVVIGDSIARGDPSANIALYLNKRTGLSVDNKGLGGEAVVELLKRWDKELGKSTPKVVIVHTGINDVNRVAASLPGYEFQYIYINFFKLMEKMNNPNIRYIVMSVPFNLSTRPDISNHPDNVNLIKSINQFLSMECSKRGLEFFDYFKWSYDNQRKQTKYYAPKNIHPSEEGFNEIGRMLYDKFFKTKTTKPAEKA